MSASQSINQPSDHTDPQSTNQRTNQPTNQSTNQPTHQPTNQPINQPTNQPTNSPTNQPINHSTNQSINQPTNQPTNSPTNQSTNQSTNQPINYAPPPLYPSRACRYWAAKTRSTCSRPSLTRRALSCRTPSEVSTALLFSCLRAHAAIGVAPKFSTPRTDRSDRSWSRLPRTDEIDHNLDHLLQIIQIR